MGTSNKTLYEMVQNAACLHSSRIAVIFDRCTEMGTMSRTYKELLSFADGLTNLLKEHCRQSGQIFGLYCHTGINLPSWILGILQFPAAYAPLDPDSPPPLSLRFMEQCGLRYAVVQSDLMQLFHTTFSPHLPVEVCAVWPGQGLTLVRVQPDDGGSGAPEQHPQAQPAEARHSAASLGSLAYALHTSGTTGLPKTVRVPHPCIVPNILHLRSLFQMAAEDVVFLASPLTFDPSVVEMFLSLSSGACLLIVPSIIKKVPDRLAVALFQRQRITVLQATPTLLGSFGGRVLRELVLSATSPLRILALGGEACPPRSVLRGWKGEGNATRFFNLYGTTEVSCWATCHQLLLDNVSEEAVPLGSALMGTAVEVRDEDGRTVSQGEGQLFIGGRDRVCFLGDEVAVAQGTMRSTGDWVEVRDVHLYYLGRKDRQVKRHGQRLHLDTLQQVLQSLPQVEVCAVTLWGGHRLVAFVVPSSSGDSAPSPRDPAPSSGDSTLSPRELQRVILGELSQLLPTYSIPESIMLLPALPLTSHGKVNMAALLQAYESQRAAPISHGALGDRDTLKEHLQKLWREALSLSDDALVAMDSHFLLSGGDSLRSLRLCHDITAAVGRALPGLLEVVLNGSFANLLRHVAKATRQNVGKDEATQKQPDHFSQVERKRKDPLPPTQAKRKQPDSLSPSNETLQPDSLSPSNETLQPDSLSPSNETLQPDSLSPSNETLKQPNGHSLLNETLQPDGLSAAGETLKQADGLSAAGQTLKQVDGLSAAGETLKQAKGLSAAGETLKQADGLSAAGQTLKQADSLSAAGQTLKQADGLAGAGETLKQPNGLSGAGETLKQADGLSAAGQTLKQADGLSAAGEDGLVRVIVVRRAGEVTELPVLSQEHELLNFHRSMTSHSARANEGIDHAHSHSARANEGIDYAHSHSARANEGRDYVHSHTVKAIEETEHAHAYTARTNDGTDHAHSHTVRTNERTVDDSTRPALALRVRWRSDTGRCVDASPVLLVSQSGGGVAFVGSHSHRLQAIALRGGALLWERVLGGRLEAAAAITPCGSLIAIGCYDGQVYFLALATGRTRWVFVAGDAVKSSPVGDQLTGLLLVGSHDGQVYALDPEARCCRWSRSCGGGAIFSSPCLHPSLRQLYVATLRGVLLCLRPESGALLWTHSMAAPFFSSPCCSGTTLCIGSVDQNIYGFSHSGDLVWEFPTEGPVFSSPCGMPASLANQKVFCGSHDGSVYCLNSCDGVLVWRFQAGSRVYSTPFLFHSDGRDLVAVATTDGKLWILGAEDGEPRASLSLPGEIFSSPVVWGRTLVVGCRNDFVYGIELSSS